jgi:hypothetical protein
MIKIKLIPIKWSSLFLLILASFNPMLTLQAATNVSGNVSGNWTLSGSPYNVTGNIQVVASQILTIEPGVEVIFHCSISLITDQLVTDDEENNSQ